MGQSRRGPAYELWVAMERFRRKHELTLEQFAARAGVGRQTLDRLRDGKDRPRLKTVAKIAVAIGIGQEDAEELAGYERFDGEGAARATEAADATPAAHAGPGVEIDAREAIRRDPNLTKRQADVVIATYDAIRNAFETPAPPRDRPTDQPAERRRAG